MSREAHVRFCERAVVKFQRATRLVVFGERHLANLLRSYQKYYNECRTHLSLGNDSPLPRAVHIHGRITVSPILGGLHHIYRRV